MASALATLVSSSVAEAHPHYAGRGYGAPCCSEVVRPLFPPGPPPVREWSQPGDRLLNALYILPYSRSTSVLGTIEDGSLALLAWTLLQEPDLAVRMRVLAFVAPHYRFLTDQAIVLVNVFDGSFTRMLRAAEILAPSIADPNNCARLVAVFPDADDKLTVRALFSF